MEIILSPIEVIVGFKSDGNILPIRFRIINNDSEYETVHVKKVLRSWTSKIGKEAFDFFSCTGNKGDCEVMFELKFEKNHGQWSLYKM